MVNILAQVKDRFNSKTKRGANVFTGQISSGTLVSDDTALTLSAIWSCLFILSETIGGLPVNLYQYKDQGKEIVKDHWIHNLLRKRPNASMTPTAFHSYLMMNLAFRGNAYIKKGTEIQGELISLTPLDSAFCEPFYDGQKKFYNYANPITKLKEVYNENEIIHIGGFSYDGLKARSLFDYAKESIGTCLAGENTAGRSLKNVHTIQGALNYTGKLTDTQRIDINKALLQMKDGGNTILINDQGTTFTPLNTISAAEMQLLEQRKFGIEEICRFFGVPPMQIGHIAPSTSWGSGMEQQDLSFLKYRLSAYIKRIEETYNSFLLPLEMQDDYFCEFNLNALMRTDSIARANMYQKSLAGAASATINEVRARENQPPIDGGDTIFVPVNLMPLNKMISGDINAENKENS